METYWLTKKIVIGDGLVPQIERYASKYAYNKLTSSVLTTALSIMREKAAKDTGNEWMLICNAKLWDKQHCPLAA